MINNYQNKLYNDGYCHIQNVITKEKIAYGKNYVNDKVNYIKLSNFINNGLQTINATTGLELKIGKYRVSNNNNSIDAAGFHRDLQVLNDIKGPVPIYTVLFYLDDNSSMELIPKSHIHYRMSIMDSINDLNNIVTIKIVPGDILIFHASIIHKGIFYNTGKNRRLIQCFDCIPYNYYDEYHSKILHLPCLNRCSSSMRNFLYKVAKIKYLIKGLDMINYLNIATGYNCKSDYMKKLNYRGIEFLSTESNNTRFKPEKDDFETINKYIITTDDIRDWKKEDMTYIHINSYLLFHIYTFIYILIFIIIIYILFHYYTPIKINKKK